MAYNNMTTAEYQKAVYDNCPEFQKMYGTFEAYFEAYARHLANKIKELGAENRLNPKHRAMAKALTEVE